MHEDMYAQAPTERATVKDGAFCTKLLKPLVMYRKMLTNLSQLFLQIRENVGQKPIRGGTLEQKMGHAKV